MIIENYHVVYSLNIFRKLDLFSLINLIKMCCHDYCVFSLLGQYSLQHFFSSNNKGAITVHKCTYPFYTRLFDVNIFFMAVIYFVMFFYIYYCCAVMKCSGL